MNKKLKKQYEEFCQQYIVDFNGARAAFDVGFGKDKSVAKVTACHLLKRPVIRKRILELLERRAKRTQITQDKVLEELAILGFSDFKDYGQIKNGSLEFNDFDKIEKGKTRAIKSVKETVSEHSRSMSLRLHEKVKPLELIGKHLGMFVDTHNVNLTGDITVISAVPRPRGKEKDNAS
jgi:phage terminase small subunit